MATTFLVLVLLIAVVTDVRTRRIPNVLILGGLVGGIAFRFLSLLNSDITVASNWTDLMLPGFTGIAVGLLCALPLYLLRAMGAGDAKLLMVVGAFLGPAQAFGVTVFTFVAGGLLALATIIYRRSAAKVLFNLRFMLITSAVRAASGGTSSVDQLPTTSGRIPYAIAIVLGTLMQLLLSRSGNWSFS